MPVVAVIDGIKILFYYRDHSPAHFHLIHAMFEAQVAIDDGRYLELSGKISRSQRRKIAAFVARHRDDLMKNWRLVTGDPAQPPIRIEDDE
jgi:hypothetical protein